MTAALPLPAVDLGEVRPCLEGAIPAIMATCAADGTPNVAYISQVFYVDERHVALSFQFFNKTRQNILAHPRATVLLLHPVTAQFYRLHLGYLRTENGGPVFESMKAQLAGIASHSGMASVFVLRGADVYEVLGIERLDGQPLPAAAPRCSLLGALRRGSTRLAQATTLAAALEATLQTLEQDMEIPHAMVLSLDPATQRLYTVASRGYATSGVGSEIPLGHGVIGVAARERTPVRINHMTSAYLYNQAMRQGMDGSDGVSTDIPYPGLAAPRSQLAVPLLSAGRVLGVLFVESGQDMRFSYEDEDMLVTLGGQLASAMALMQSCEEGCDEAPPAEPPAVGDLLTVCIRPECLKLDLMAPDENAFAGSITASLFQGDVSLHDFKTKEGVVLKVSEANPRQRVGSKATVFAWAEPEDVVGLNR